MAVFEPAKGGGLILKSFGASSILADPAQEMARLPQIEVALKELAEKQKVQRERVRYALSGHAVFTRFVKLPSLEEGDIDQLVAFEAQQHVPFPIEDVVWDWQLLDSAGPDKEVVLVAIKSDALTEINEVVADAGLGTREVDVAPMALYNAFRYNYPEAGEPVLLVDIGAKATNLLYIEGKRLFTRSVAIGGTSVTTAIAKEYNVSFVEAENQKVSNGMVSLGGRHTEQLDEATAGLATVIRGAMNRLPAEISRTTNHYRAQHEGNAPARVFLAGGGANLLYLPEFLEERLRLPIELFNPLKRVSVSRSLDVEKLAVEAHTMGELVGLGLRGVGEAPLDIDLVPETEGRKRETARRRPFLIAAAVILLAGIAVWAANKASLASEAEEEARDKVAEKERLTPIVNRIEALREKQETLARIGGRLADAENLRIRWVVTLDELRKYFASESVWVRDFAPLAMHEKGVAESGEVIIKENFPTLGYGETALQKVRARASGTPQGPGKRKEAAPRPPAINAVKVAGFWRENPRGPRVVNAIVDKIRQDRGGVFDLTIGDGEAARPLKDTEVFRSFQQAIDDENLLAAPFTMVLPLAEPLPLE